MAECLNAFVHDLTDLLNRYRVENGSNTPDFILAEYLLKCLETWNATVVHRETWYGRVQQRFPQHMPSEQGDPGAGEPPPGREGNAHAPPI